MAEQKRADYASTRPQADGAWVARVEEGSPAWDAGIEPGMRIVTVNGVEPRDIIDWRWEADGGWCDLEVFDPTDGTTASCELEREPGEDWGIEFTDVLFDGIRTCLNACVFCFMAMLPKEARATLTLRDDDYRLSFLQGNFVTLTNVTDEDVENRLNEMADRNSRLVSVEREIQKGDTADIDFEGFDNGVPFDGGKGENFDLEIGSGSFVPGFEDQLVGMKAGEEKDIDITFPENYTPELAGKPVVFHVKVNEVKHKEVPAIDDEFAKDVSEFDTLEELKADTRKQLTDDREAAAQRAFEDALMQKVADGIQADIPDEMVDVQAQQMMENFQQQLAAQGIPFDQYLKMTNTTEDDFKKQAHDPAVQQVRMDLAVAALVKAEELEATAEEIEAEMKSVADKYGMDLDTIKKYLPEADVREQVLRSKAIKAVADAAVAVAPVVEETKEEAKQEAEKKDEE